MADNGLWFKLWCSALNDQHLDNMPIADFGRWAKFGTYVKQHGDNGSITLSAPAKSLCAMFQVERFTDLVSSIKRFPHCSVSPAVSPPNGEGQNTLVSVETGITVTFHNWSKYQGDFSSARVRRHREMKRLRGEEKRGEEKRQDERRGEETYSAHAQFIKFFFDLYQTTFKEKYLVDGKKDGATVQRLLETYSLEELKKFVELFFKSEDKFIHEAGFTIGVFSSQINKIVAQGKRQGGSSSGRPTGTPGKYAHRNAAGKG